MPTLQNDMFYSAGYYEKERATMEESKTARRKYKESLKKFVGYARSQGSTSSAQYYTAFSKLFNKAADAPPAIHGKISLEQLEKESGIRQAISDGLEIGMSEGNHYDAIYRMVSDYVLGEAA